MKALADWCTRNGVRLISDEIYHGIVYEGDTVSAVEVSDSAIVVNSFSKYFSMTGWRVGWLVVPPDLVRPIERLTPELLHLRADAQPACRARGLRRPRRARRPCPALPHQPRPADGRPAGGRPRPPRAGRRARSTSIADVAHLTNDSRDFCRRMLARGGRGDDAGRRLRPRARRRHPAHLLRRLDRRDGRGGAAPARRGGRS